MTSTLNYQQQGSGPDILLIHGLLGSLENLNMVAKGLKDNYTVTSVDVRNHGNSFHENNMDYAVLAQDIINTMESLNIKNAHVLGHSMGGKIAMQLALSFPEKVNKLLVADIAPVTYPPHHNHIISGLKSLDLKNIKSRKEADKQLANFVDEASIRQFLLRNLTPNDGSFSFKCNIEFISNCYHQVMQAYSGLATFTGDTLFIKGGNSDYILAEHRAVIKKLFPNSKAKIIQGTGHWLHAEKTVAFNKIVNDFLNKS
ncbi:MAG: alpha/beta fold hydrolase [Colwellia sp.]|nr:alpha/beta fold hydrolase [Colwellia sp.]